ncbi:MAG TPA: DUF4382 domain-containing protein [Steroidobacteraceae bacterium]|nr:DUF4382 domain-containing protein [Steroidobacteraceae bacterium]
MALAGIAAALAGCSSRTNVSATGNTPATYSHVYVTAQAVWFNGSAGAGPDDGGWVKFPLSTPVTVDLVADSGGNFGTLVTDLKLAPGSYAQLRLIPLDASAPLASSAQTLGAAYNMEADYLDSSGVTHQQPLELLSPDKGMGIQASLSVPFGNIGAALAAVNSPAATTPTTSFGVVGTPTTPTTTTPTTTTTTTSTTTTAQFAVGFDGARDLTPFTYAGASAILLNPHENAYDLSLSGGIQGQLTLTNLTGISGASGLPDIQVSAESLTADGSRHFVVASAPVSSSGSFMLYPLASNVSNPTSYDLVIHGPGIATIIIKSIQIPLASPAAAAGASTGTTSATTSTGPTPVQPTNLVSVGTLIPRAASSYSANIATVATAPLPAGAEVAFYQTLPSAGEVPYVIAVSPIDPFNQVLANARTLSSGTVDSGTYVASGATVTVVSAAPRESAGSYQVAATAPLYADGLLGTLVSAPATGSVAPPVTVAGLVLAAGGSAATLNASVSQASAGKYDQGEILVSRDGQLVASAALDAVLRGGGGTVVLNGLPGGTSANVYYLTVRAWNSSNPSGTLTRQWYPAAVDLRSAGAASVALTLN